MKKKRRLTKHHIVPRSRGGSNDPENIMWLSEKKHEAWHILFANKTIPEIIGLLKKIQKRRRL